MLAVKGDPILRHLVESVHNSGYSEVYTLSDSEETNFYVFGSSQHSLDHVNRIMDPGIFARAKKQGNLYKIFDSGSLTERMSEKDIAKLILDTGIKICSSALKTSFLDVSHPVKFSMLPLNSALIEELDGIIRRYVPNISFEDIYDQKVGSG